MHFFGDGYDDGQVQGGQWNGCCFKLHWCGGVTTEHLKQHSLLRAKDDANHPIMAVSLWQGFPKK